MPAATGSAARFAGRLPVEALDPSAPRHDGCAVRLRGYVANRGELAGLVGRADSDEELIARAYRRWGAQLHARVDGEYALVLVDERDGSALLTHDRTGTVGLYYARGPGGGVEFASHLIDLARERLDDDYLADYLVHGFADSERTPYAGVNRLTPGQSIRVERNHVRVLRTWDPAKLDPVRYASDAEYEERFRELLHTGIGGACDDAAAPWCELSGGLDSSTIASVAARTRDGAVGALSFLFPQFDEELWMRDVVEMHGLDWERLRVEEAPPFSAPPGGEFGEPSVTLTDLAFRARRDDALTGRGADVLLTGGGGDAVLCSASEPRHLADPLFRLRPGAAVRDLRAWRRGWPARRSHLYWAVRHVAEPTIDHLRGRAFRQLPDHGLPPWFSEEYRRAMRLERRRRTRRATRCPAPGMQAQWEEVWTMASAAAVGGQRETPYAVRHPLLLGSLVEFMLAIPWEQKLRPDCDRYLQRRALRGILPETVRRRANKAAFTRSILEGLSASREWLELLTDSPLIAERGIVPLDAWRDAVAQARFGRTHTDRDFMTAVSLEAWLQQHAARYSRPANSVA